MAIDLTRPFRKMREAMGRAVGRPPKALQEHLVPTGRHVQMPSRTPFDDETIVEYLVPDELLRRKGWQVYEEMRHDEQIKAAISMKTTLVAARQWVVKPASDSDEDKRVADFVHNQMERINLNEMMRGTCQAFIWGFALGEIVWQVQQWQGQPVIGIKKVPFRDPDRLRFRANKHGEVTEIEQETDLFLGNTEHFIRLPANKVFHYAYNPQFGNPYGNSDLRDVYKNWFSKKYIINFWNVLLERLGSPVMMAKYPTGASDGLKEALQKILKSTQNKSEMLIPEGVEIELLEATRAGNGGYEQALNYHDNAIARGILVPALLGMSSQVTRGSDSQARIHVRTLFKMMAEIGDAIINELQKQIIIQLVDFNFDVDEYPVVELGDYGEYEAEVLTDAIRLLHAAGILELDGDDTNKLRSLVNLPIRDQDDVDEVIRPPQPPPPGNANAPPPSAAQGNQQGSGRQTRTGAGGSTGGAGGTGTQS